MTTDHNGNMLQIKPQIDLKEPTHTTIKIIPVKLDRKESDRARKKTVLFNN